ncbi:hypothetical protein EDD86DRAFT_111740 [Gorgonomyces haynaldii]|nr:hypothetical protein EDD86DRAFT_111740 [Gorgonomyces haynaldii]
MLTAIQISILTFKAIVFASSVSFLGFLLKSTFAGLVLLKKLRIMMTASVLSQILDLVFYSYISVIVKFDVPAVVILLVYISAIMSYLLLLVRQELAFFRKVIHLTGVNPVMIKRFRIVHFGLYCLGVGSALGTCMECIFSPATFASGLAIFVLLLTPDCASLSMLIHCSHGRV